MRTSNQCPACGATELDESIEGVGPVCTQCGAVIQQVDEIGSNIDDETAHDQESDESPSDEWDERHTVHNSTQKNIATALEQLEELADTLSVSTECREEAAELYAEVAQSGLTDGRPTEVTIAAVLHITCRNAGEPRPMMELAEATNREKSQIDLVSRAIQRELDLQQPVATPDEYVSHIRTRLGLCPDAERRAVECLQQFSGTQYANGKNPAGIAGAALYWIASDEVTQREVARAAGVTEETIRVRLDDLRVVLNG